MRDFLRAIWNEQFLPTVSWMEKSEELREIEKLIERHKAQLEGMLEKNGRETLEKMSDCEIELNTLSTEEAFVCGVRFAVHFLVEAMR